MTAPKTPSDPPSGEGSPTEPATTAAQAIALAATTDEAAEQEKSPGPADSTGQEESQTSKSVDESASSTEFVPQAQSTEQTPVTEQQPSSAQNGQPLQQPQSEEGQATTASTQQPFQQTQSKTQPSTSAKEGQQTAPSTTPKPAQPRPGQSSSGQPAQSQPKVLAPRGQPPGQTPRIQPPKGQTLKGQTPQGQSPRGQPPQSQIPQGPPPQGQHAQAQSVQGQPHQGQIPPGQPHPGQLPPDQPLPGQHHPGQPQPNQPVQYGQGPNGQPLYVYPPGQGAANYQPLGPLQPLPRGRPPRPKPPGNVWGRTPVAQVGQPADGTRKPPVVPSYTRGGHLLGGYNPARYMGMSHTPQFNPNGKFFYLTGPASIKSWISEITYMARALSCYEEMTQRFVGFPPVNTVQLFICETRLATAWRVLEATISGQVWAYMRVLGYSSIPASTDNQLMSPMPADCFEFAQRAAARMLVPGTAEQPQEERKRMVDEILTAQATEYPSERTYKKGIKWLRLACDGLVKQGDYDLAVSLYDPIPEWAPRPEGHQTPGPETDADADGTGIGTAASPEEKEEQPAASAPASASPVEQAVETTSVSTQATPSAAHATPVPAASNPPSAPPKAKKRKRAQKDDGANAASASKQRGNIA